MAAARRAGDVTACAILNWSSPAFGRMLKGIQMVLGSRTHTARDFVDAYTPVRRERGSPLGLDQFLFKQPLQGRIQRTLFHLQDVVGTLLNVLHQSVSVGGLAAERLENHHLEGAGEKIAGRAAFVCHEA